MLYPTKQIHSRRHLDSIHSVSRQLLSFYHKHPRLPWFDLNNDMSEPSKEILSNSAALHALKRPQLNRLCKRFGLTAKGKVRVSFCDYKPASLRVFISEYRAYW